MIVIEAGFTGTLYPTSHPLIAAFPIAGTVAASTAAAGFDADFAADGETWTLWRPTAVPATWDITFASQAVSYFGIAAHDMGSVGASVAFQRWNGSAWVTVASHTPADNEPILLLALQRTMDRARFSFTGAVPTIGILAVGDVTEFPQKAQFTGSVPFNEAVETEYRDAISDGGHVVARFATRRAQAAEMTVMHLSEAWAAATLDPLRRHMQGAAVFMADRPVDYPQSLVFGRSPEPFRAVRGLPKASVSRDVTIAVRGHGPV